MRSEALPGGEEACTIGQLAEAAEVAVSTLRYYERRGLLHPTCRSPGNYRLFGPEAVERVCFIRAAQAVGFTLEDIQVLVAFLDGQELPCQRVRALIEGRLAVVEQRLAEMTRLRQALLAALSECQKSEGTARCRVVAGLREATLEKISKKKGIKRKP